MKNQSAFVCCLVVCLALAGCGVSYPHYTTEGSPESRTVIVHLDEKTTLRVGAGTGMGAGITAAHKAKLAAGEDAVIEKDDVKVTMSGKSGGAVVKSVTYKGEPVLYHEQIL